VFRDDAPLALGGTARWTTLVTGRFVAEIARLFAAEECEA
jgi:hypothetical protein